MKPLKPRCLHRPLAPLLWWVLGGFGWGLGSSLGYAQEACRYLVATAADQVGLELVRDVQAPDYGVGTAVERLKGLLKPWGIEVVVRYSETPASAEEEVRSGRMDLLLATETTLNAATNVDVLKPALLPDQAADPTGVGVVGVYVALSQDSACATSVLRQQLSAALAGLSHREE